ncbi:methyltransferase domain-containing protein [Acuticoccus kandeliae]|uniref:methyltransferase domain-containing protein n=1 Tax=Acuticoccus kandeliae TaxID=2073160 RepID=UPI000D3EBDC6|nr:methyltransferase domain-containing protein [Acuticoccus kandeliae]
MKTRNVDAYAELHRRRTYGNTAVRMRRFVEPWVQIDRPKTLIDYGAGQGRFGEILTAPTLEVRDSYDPAIPEIATLKSDSYDYAICIDVMEHLEPDEVAGVLKHVASLTKRALFIIDTRPARAILPDGRNAHTMLQPPKKWQEMLATAFGEAVAVPVFRKGRCAFKTYRSSPSEWLAYWGKFGPAEVDYQLWRLKGGRYEQPPIST